MPPLKTCRIWDNIFCSGVLYFVSPWRSSADTHLDYFPKDSAGFGGGIFSMPELYLVLHNIRSQYNVGSIFRTADGVGVTKIFLTGYTPSPLDEFGQPRKEIQKTALGAEKFVDWEKVKDIGKLIDRLRKEKVYIAAVEQARGAVDYKKFKPKFPLALIFGNEVRGLDKRVLKKCDKIVQIPMYGKKESLNVAVAAGIVAYEVKRQT